MVGIPDKSGIYCVFSCLYNRADNEVLLKNSFISVNLVMLDRVSPATKN